MTKLGSVRDQIGLWQPGLKAIFPSDSEGYNEALKEWDKVSKKWTRQRTRYATQLFALFKKLYGFDIVSLREASKSWAIRINGEIVIENITIIYDTKGKWDIFFESKKKSEVETEDYGIYFDEDDTFQEYPHCVLENIYYDMESHTLRRWGKLKEDDAEMAWRPLKDYL